MRVPKAWGHSAHPPNQETTESEDNRHSLPWVARPWLVLHPLAQPSAVAHLPQPRPCPRVQSPLVQPPHPTLPAPPTGAVEGRVGGRSWL